MSVRKLWLAAAAALSLAACAPTAVVTPPSVRETVVVPVTVEVPVDSEPGRLVVYSGRAESLVAPLIAQFAAATGIDVQVRYGSTAEMAATILEEGANSP